MRLRFTLLVITLGVLVLSACDTNTTFVAGISVDFPHGELRLLVQRDNETRLFYGAHPAHRVVQSNIFNIDDLFQQLQPRLHENVAAENRRSDLPYGMAIVEFSDGSEQDYLIYDKRFVIELFQTACANLLEEDESGAEIVTAECAKLGSAPP